MKKFLLLVVACFMMLGLASCGTKVPAGYVGVKVYLLGKSKGVDSEVLGVGRYWVGINEELFLYPVYVQQYKFTAGRDGDSQDDEAFYFQNKDGVKCSIDLSIQAHADPAKVSVLFQKYRDDLRDVIHVNLRTFIQNKVQTYASDLSVEELYSSKKIIMINRLEADLKAEVSNFGIIVDAVSLLSDVRFPLEVEQAIVAKIKATQEAMQRENEVQKAKADAEIKIANAKGEAEAFRLKGNSVTTMNIELERLNVMKEAIQKWDGSVPTTVIMNGANGQIMPYGIPLMNK